LGEKKTGKNEHEEDKIDVDLGILGLNGIFDLVNKIASLGMNAKDLESKLQEYKAGGKIRSDIDIRVGGLIGNTKDFHISSGTFFKHLDELAEERRGKYNPTPSREVNISPKDMKKTELTADIIEQDDLVYVLTQVPHSKEDIEVKFVKHRDNGELIIEAPKHGYRRLIPINAKVNVPDNGEVQWNYKNQVVEAILPKASTDEKDLDQ